MFPGDIYVEGDDGTRTTGAVAGRAMRRHSLAPIALGMFWTFLLVALFAWNADNERRHFANLAKWQAKAFFQQVVSTRAWNAAHGGVYVQLNPAVQPNRSLPAAERQVTTTGGLTLVKVNPAYMTRLIGAIAASEVGVLFHITSLDPLEPLNAPDDWERAVLVRLTPEDDAFELVADAAGGYYRYMAPLIATEACRRCHPEDALGAVRGGISVSIPAQPLISAQTSRIHDMAAAYVIIWIVGLTGIAGSAWQLSRKRSEAEAANRLKGRFLANMSHDMRTPLNGIIGFTDLLRRDGLEDPKRRYADLIGHSARTLLEMVTDILDFARIESGRMQIDTAPFTLRATVDKVLDLFRYEAESKGLALSARIDPDVPDALVGDEFRLRQVLGNLLSNAVKFTDAGAVQLEVGLDNAPERLRDNAPATWCSASTTPEWASTRGSCRTFSKASAKPTRPCRGGMPGPGWGWP